MKNNKLMSKKIIIAISIFYAINICIFVFLLLTRNSLGFYEVGNRYYINSSNLVDNSVYKKGNIIVVEKVRFEDIKQDDDIILYKRLKTEKNVLFIISKVDEVNNDKNGKYITIKNDKYHWNDKNIVGSVKGIYHGVGYFVYIFDSGLIFFLLLLVPALAMFIYELYTTFNSQKNKVQNKEEEIEILEEYPEPKEELSVNNTTNNFDDSKNQIDSKNVIFPDDGKYDASSVEKPSIIVPNIDLSEDEIHSNNLDSIIEDKLSSIVIKVKDNDDESSDSNVSNDDNDDDLVEDINIEEKVESTPIVIGKGIKNFVLKALELKKYEIFDIINIINNARNNIEFPDDVLKNIFSMYINDKYLEPIDYNESDLKNRDNVLIEKIRHYTDNIRILDFEQKKEITELLLFYNKLDSDYGNLYDVIHEIITFESDSDKKIVADCIKEKGDNYNKLLKKFSEKISSTKVFDLVLSDTVIDNVYNTQLKTNIKFSKVFSDYIIDKSYDQSTISENLQEVLLKLISALLLNEMFSYNYINKYILFFNKSLYSNEEKINNFIDNFNDVFSQRKILLLIDDDFIDKYADLLNKLKNKGFRFIIQIEKSTIMSADFDNKNLAFGEYIFIIGQMGEDELKALIPTDLLTHTFCINEALNTEVIKQ